MILELALPNLHPAIVHLPLVVLPLALVFELLSAWRRSNRTLARVAQGLWLLGAVGATAAFFAGRSAADGLLDVPPEVWPAVNAHANLAQWVLLSAWTVAIARAAGGLRTGAAGQLSRVWAVAVGTALGPLLFLTADAGGALVYQHALAVKLPPPPEAMPCPEASEASDGPRAVLVEDGSTVSWTPGSPDAVFTGFEDPNAGGLVHVQGEVEHLLPGPFADVQVNVWLDLSDYSGEAAVLHHAAEGRAGSVVVTETEVRLVGADGSVLDTASQARPGQLALSVNAAGSHLKGMIDGAVVTHGHAPAQEPGAVGLRFTGRGTVALERLEAIRLGHATGH